jgi:hypothetical protein
MSDLESPTRSLRTSFLMALHDRGSHATLIAVLLAGEPGVMARDGARRHGPSPSDHRAIAVKNGQLLISVGLQDLFGPGRTPAPTSGFSTRILIRVASAGRDGARPTESRWRSAVAARPRSSTTSGDEIVQRARDARPGRRAAARWRPPPEGGDLAGGDRALAQFPIAGREPLAGGAGPLRGCSVRGDSQADLGGSDWRTCAGLARAAGGARAAAAGRGGDSFFGSSSASSSTALRGHGARCAFVSQPFALPNPRPRAPDVPCRRDGRGAVRPGRGKRRRPNEVAPPARPFRAEVPRGPFIVASLSFAGAGYLAWLTLGRVQAITEQHQEAVRQRWGEPSRCTGPTSCR